MPADDGAPMKPVARGLHRRAVRRQSRFRPSGLAIALGVSVALHLILLAMRFVMPHASLFKPPDSPLEVILVNAKSADKALKPDAVAQFDLNGGGEHDTGRATSFLPRRPQVADGEVLKQSQSEMQRLEAEQRHLVAQTRASPIALAPESPQKVEANDTAPTAHPTTAMKAIARLEAQVDKQTRDYNARPRRGYIGPTTRGTSYAMYYSRWKDKVERIGTINYPAEARGRIYGDLTLRVTLNPNGTIYNGEVEVTRSSGSSVLDRAARRIVLLGAPYDRFSDELKSEYDIYEIFSTFRFTKGDALEMRSERK
ncbi:MAG: TonB family protein [Burkholderiaceae bacterium]